MKKSLFILIIFMQSLFSDIHIRHNQAGYLTSREEKSLVLISSKNLAGTSWRIEKSGETVLSGTVQRSITGRGEHTSHPFNHRVDFSKLNRAGTYFFHIGNKVQKLVIDDQPYAVHITDALRHLRTARSGVVNPRDRKDILHSGDSIARVYRIKGSPSDGRWEPLEPKRTVNMLGGWYDAGDYIKFTLTIATTAYYLLEAYETNPNVFTKVLSQSSLPDILEEAKFGLDYLLKTMPDPNTFIIQVGDARDHQMGMRLPEHDPLDGKRPALSALSPVHMGLTAAALAKGARVFRATGYEDVAKKYEDKAIEIFKRARSKDALKETAYEKDKTNDFYRDNTIDDNMALASIELYKTTGSREYLEIAKSYNIQPGLWVSWGNYHLSANILIAEHSAKAKDAARREIEHFISAKDTLWGIPMSYPWASLHCWNGVGALAAQWNRSYPTKESQLLHNRMIDLLFGVNNWGIAFIASTRLENSVKNIYSQIYTITGEFPHGAIALGPVNRESHLEMQRWMGAPPRSPLDSFHTKSAVFYDWNKDFVTSETVTMSQAYAIWLMAHASSSDIKAVADSTLPEYIQAHKLIEKNRWKAPLSRQQFFLFADDNSSAEWMWTAPTTANLAPKAGVDYPYAGLSVGLPDSYRDQDNFDGVWIFGSITSGMPLRLNFNTPEITDYDHYGTIINGAGEEPIQVLFSNLSQQGFGQQKPFKPNNATAITFTNSNIRHAVEVRVDSLHFFNIDE